MRSAVIGLTPFALMALACPGVPVEPTITQAQAIEIARPEVSFTPESVEAVLATDRESAPEDRAVWRVTFRGRLPGQPPGLFETLIVEVDAETGEIVSLGRT